MTQTFTVKPGLFFQYLAFLFLVLFSTTSVAQQTDEKVEELYQHAESIYSTDDLLVNGESYIPSRPRAKGNPYFNEDLFAKGEVVIHGREFKNVLLKYNLENQSLILRAALASEKYVTLVLRNNLVDLFRLEGVPFVNGGNFFENPALTGYFQLVNHGKETFLIQYEKTFNAVYDRQTPEGSYSKIKKEYYLYDGKELIVVTRKASFLNRFSTHKKEIKAYLRKHKIKYKKASAQSLRQLMNYCETLHANK